jgi:putative FmdB family regulatory protein
MKYRYYCETCGDIYTKEKKMLEDHPDCCPKCGGSLKRIYSAPQITFKGNDYYCKSK